MITITLGLLLAAQTPVFSEKPPSETFCPNAYFEMDTSYASGPFEYRLNGATGWKKFFNVSDSTTRLFLTSGNGVISNYNGGVNTIEVREVGANPPYAMHTWEVVLPAFEDGNDTRGTGDSRTWHTMSSSEIATVDGDPLARLGFLGEDRDNPLDPGFQIADRTKQRVTYFAKPGATGNGQSLDTPGDFTTSVDLQDYERVICLSGDYTDTDPFQFVPEASGGAAPDFEVLAAPGARIVQEDGSSAMSFIGTSSTTKTNRYLVQGFEILAEEHSNNPSAGVGVITVNIRFSNEIRVDSCKIYGGNGTGIVISEEDAPGIAENIWITNCEIYDMFTENVDRHGILVGPETVSVNIHGNHIYHNSGDSVQILAGEKRSPAQQSETPADLVSIAGNRMHDDAENAIDMWSSEETHVLDNLIYGYSKATMNAPESPAIKIHHGALAALIEYNQIAKSKKGILISNGDESGWSDSSPPLHYPKSITIRRNLIVDGEVTPVEGYSTKSFGIDASGCEDIWIANNEFRNLDYAISMNYDEIEYHTPSSYATIVSPSHKPIVNNLFVGIQEHPAVDLTLLDNGSWGTWSSYGDNTFAPSAYISDLDYANAVQLRIELRLAPLVYPNWAQQDVEYWSDLVISGVGSPLDGLQSGVVPTSFVYPMELSDWHSKSIDDLTTAGPSYSLIDLVGEGAHHDGITNDDRSGAQNPPNIGVY